MARTRKNDKMVAVAVRQAIAQAKPETARQDAEVKLTKADWFTADRKLAENVTDFMVRTLWYAQVRDERVEYLKDITEDINSLQRLRKSALWDGNHANELLRKMDEKAKMEKMVDEWIKNGIRWKQSDFTGLPEFQKAYKKAYLDGEDLSAPIVSFFKTYYSIDITGTEDLVVLTDAIRGDGMASMKTTVTSDGNQWTDARRDASKVMLRKLAEILIDRGTVKPAKVAPELKARYASKKTSKKSKKSEKKLTKTEVIVPAYIEAQADAVANAPANME